jgi:hypothetical protein
MLGSILFLVKAGQAGVGTPEEEAMGREMAAEALLWLTQKSCLRGADYGANLP